MTIKERVSKKVEDWKEDIEQIEDQLEHTGENVKDAFEQQKAKLSHWIEEVKKDLDRMEDVGEEKAKNFKGKLEELRVQAALGKADAEDVFHERQKQLNLAVHNTKVAVAKFKKTASEKTNEFLEKSQQTLDRFHTSFDMFRLQMDLGRKDAKQNWQEKRKDIMLRVNTLKAKLAKAQEQSTDRWEHFSEEMAEAWTHVKEAVKQ